MANTQTRGSKVSGKLFTRCLRTALSQDPPFPRFSMNGATYSRSSAGPQQRLLSDAEDADASLTRESPRQGRKPHIGHVVDCFGAGGIATGVLDLIRASQGLVEHSIISLVDDLRLSAQLPTKPAAYVIEPGRTRLLGFSSRLAWLAYRKHIDILHCNNHFAWLDSSLAARLTGGVCLQTFHGVEK